jgi:carboxyl-terminal processing protease
MSKAIKWSVITVSLTAVLFVAAGSLVVRASSNDGAYRQIGVYSEVLSRIRSEYVEDPNMGKVTDGALHGLLESLDANSSYLSPEQYKDFKSHPKLGKADIGAAISKRFGYAAVIAVIPGGPADKAGVEKSDIVEAIEGKSTRDLSLAEIHDMLSGQQGSTVNISVVRARRSEPKKITITRELVTPPPVSDRLMQDGIGYIKTDTLNKGKSQEIAAKIKALEKSGAKKLLLDLRNCAQGDEEEGIAVANLFLNHGTIAYVQGQKYPKRSFNADPQQDITRLPLVVLVNRGTAGPAEIVAAAVQDNGRGDVVGDKTFGVGTISKVFEVPDGSALILSIAKYYSPAGKAIADAAVTPNVLAADSDDDAVLPDEDETTVPADQDKKIQQQQDDQQLHKAIEVLENRKAS